MDEGMNRRGFLKKLGLVSGAAAAIAVVPLPALASTSPKRGRVVRNADGAVVQGEFTDSPITIIGDHVTVTNSTITATQVVDAAVRILPA